MKETLIKRKTVFSDLFSKEIVTFEDSKACSLSRPFVFCHDLDEFIARILFLRDDENLNNEDKLGFDDGKGILKLTLSLYDPEDRIPLQPDTNTRTLRSGSNSSVSKFKNSGVNKIFLLAASPKTPESYANCKVVLDRVLTGNVKYHFAADLKMANICLGIMSHASTHPFPYCEGTKNVFEDEAPERCMAKISEYHNKWKDESGKKATLKNYLNCSNEPLLLGSHDPSTAVLSIVPPPALHIKLGIVNKLYAELYRVLPQLDEWPEALYIQKEQYHGQTFEGNECNKLLKNLDMLLRMLPEHLRTFHACFVALKDAMDACFSFNLDPSYENKLARFEEAYKALDISITT